MGNDQNTYKIGKRDSELKIDAIMNDIIDKEVLNFDMNGLRHASKVNDHWLMNFTKFHYEKMNTCLEIVALDYEGSWKFNNIL